MGNIYCYQTKNPGDHEIPEDHITRTPSHAEAQSHPAAAASTQQVPPIPPAGTQQAEEESESSHGITTKGVSFHDQANVGEESKPGDVDGGGNMLTGNFETTLADHAGAVVEEQASHPPPASSVAGAAQPPPPPKASAPNEDVNFDVHIDILYDAGNPDEAIPEQEYMEEKFRQAMGENRMNDLKGVAARIKEIENNAAEAVRKKASEIPEKLEKGDREATLQFIVEAITAKVDVNPMLYEKLYEQYDSDKTNNLNLEKMRTFITEAIHAEDRFYDKLLSKGGSIEQIEQISQMGMFSDDPRAEFEQKKERCAQFLASLDQQLPMIRNTMDIDRDGKISKQDFLNSVESILTPEG